MVDFETSEMIVDLLREINSLKREVSRLRWVEAEYTELLRRTNTHNAIMSKQVIEAMLGGIPKVPHAEDRTLG